MRFLNFLNHVVVSDKFKIKDTKLLNERIKSNLSKFEINPLLRGIFDGAEFTFKDSKIKINNFPLAEFINHFRKLELDQAFSKINVKVPNKTIKFFKEMFIEEPQFNIEKAKQIKTALLKIEPKLRSVRFRGDFEILYEGNSKLKKALSGFKNVAEFVAKHPAVLVTGLTATFLYNRVRQYQNEMYGCIKTQTINGKITHCRDDKKSCNRKKTPFPETEVFISPCDSSLVYDELKFELEKNCKEDNISNCYNCNSLELNTENGNFVPFEESAQNIHYECVSKMDFSTALSKLAAKYRVEIEEGVEEVISKTKNLFAYFIYFIVGIIIIVGIFFSLKFINNVNKVIPS